MICQWGRHRISSFEPDEGLSRKDLTADSFRVLRAVAGQLPDPAFEQDLQYIQKKTQGDRFASRADIVPQEIIDILPEIAFVTPILDDDGRVLDLTIKLEGTMLVSFYGEHTGHKTDDGFDPEVRMRLIAAVASCLKTRAPVLAELRLHSSLQRKVIVRSLYIPLSDDGQTIDSCFVHFRIQYENVAIL